MFLRFLAVFLGLYGSLTFLKRFPVALLSFLSFLWFS